MQGWKADAAVALAPVEHWIEALKQGLNLSIPGSSADIHTLLDALVAGSGQVNYQPQDLTAGWGGDQFLHNRIRQDLTMALFQIAKQLGGQSLGRDFVMRLGENGFTPDLLFFKCQGHNRLSYYLDGPAELVIEVLRPGHEYCDRVIKRQYYEAAGVPEYWILDSNTQQIEFWRWMDGQYQQQSPDDDGFYRPISVPGLAFQAPWQEENWYWWQLARQATNLLRDQFGLTHIGAIRDLVRPQPLNYWSEVTLVTRDADMPKHWEIYNALSELSEDPEIRLLQAEKDYLTLEEKSAIAGELVEL